MIAHPPIDVTMPLQYLVPKILRYWAFGKELIRKLIMPIYRHVLWILTLTISSASDTPTSGPTGFPSGLPSSLPSSKPSAYPTLSPTAAPTIETKYVCDEGSMKQSHSGV